MTIQAVPEDQKIHRMKKTETIVPGVIIVFFFLAVFLFASQKSFSVTLSKSTINFADAEHSHQNHGETTTTNNKYLSGLLSPNFSEQDCVGRYKSSTYRKRSPFPVSPHLIKRLREYEEYHMKCGPNSELYKQHIERLKSGRNIENSECRYAVSTNTCGLGNRMLSLASTFLYALLTNRVLLLGDTAEMQDLFCEPFPDSSWVLPSNFPVRDLGRLKKDTPESYLFMVENKTISGDVNISPDSLPPLVYLHAESLNLRLPNHIFCEDDQRILQKFNWMVVRSHSYFVPALFLMPMYEKELSLLFPVKESVFHHLGRFLFQPANPVWEMIERYYRTYLEYADEKIGIQIRIFPHAPDPFEKVYGRILECSNKENILPQIGPSNITKNSSNKSKRTAILVVSLLQEYFDKIKSTYYENSTVTGELVSVHQPTHELQQKTEAKYHNQKALAEMYLLSYCDKLVTSTVSTFGYVSNGLAGLKPYIVRTTGWMQSKDGPACVKSFSAEPCLHSPPIIPCQGKGIDSNITGGFRVPHIRQCEDNNSGFKMFD